MLAETNLDCGQYSESFVSNKDSCADDSHMNSSTKETLRNCWNHCSTLNESGIVWKSGPIKDENECGCIDDIGKDKCDYGIRSRYELYNMDPLQCIRGKPNANVLR